MRPEPGRRTRRTGEAVSVGEILSAAAGTVGVSPHLAALVSDRNAWASVVGADLADSASPVRFSDGVLVVVASDTVGETRFRFATEAVRLAVNEHLGREEVEAVVVRRPASRP